MKTQDIESRHWHEMWQNASQENNVRKEMFVRLNWKYRHLVKRHEQLKERYKGQRLHAENLQARLDARINQSFEADLLKTLDTLQRYLIHEFNSKPYEIVSMMRQAIENDLKSRQ